MSHSKLGIVGGPDIKLSEIKTLRATSNVLALYIWCSDLVSMET